MHKTLLNSLLFVILFSATTAHAVTWKELITNKLLQQSSQTYKFLWSQYQAFTNNKVPKIADQNITQIPIKESSEPLIDIRKAQNKRIQMLPNPWIPYTSIAHYCAGTNASSQIRKGLFDRLQQTIQHLDTLSSQFGYQPGQINIKVFEGLRSVRAQTVLFYIKVITIMFTQWVGITKAQELAARFVSPVKNNVPVHCTGAAIDLRLWNNKNNHFLDMGAFGAFGDTSAISIFSENLTDIQKKNRLLLLWAAGLAGLVNYPYEWWHFSYGDRYATYWLEPDSNKREAQYGLITHI